MAKDTKPKKAAPEEVTGEENRKKAPQTEVNYTPPAPLNWGKLVLQLVTVAAVVIVEAIAVTDVVKVAAIAINYSRNNPNKWRKFKTSAILF